MKVFARPALIAATFTVIFATEAQAYGPLGHEIVSAIAEERLANTPTAARLRTLLDGLTLEKTSVILDEIKGWDSKGADDLRSFRYSAHRTIDKQLGDFWRARKSCRNENRARKNPDAIFFRTVNQYSDQAWFFFPVPGFLHCAFSSAYCSAERIPFACLRNVRWLSLVQPAFMHSACQASIFVF